MAVAAGRVLEEPSRQWELAVKRAAVIEPLAARSRLTHATVDEAARELGLCRSLVYRLIARYRREPGVKALLPEKRGRREHSRTLDPEVELLLSEAVTAFRLEGGMGQIKDLVLEVATRCRAAGLRPPHYRSVRKRLFQANEQVNSRD